MPNIQIPPSNLSATAALPMTRNIVSVKREWADPWTAVPHLRPVMTEQAVAPSVSQAELVWKFGEVMDAGRTTWQTKYPLPLRDYFVRVETLSSYGGRHAKFIGVIVDDEADVANVAAAYTGEQRLRAYGLEHLLDQVTLHEAWVSDAHGVGKRPFVPMLNARGKFGPSYRGNRTATVPAGRTSHVFGSGGTWTNLDFLRYLLEEVTPRGVTFNLAGQYDVLAELVVQIRLEHQTVKTLLDVLIPRQLGHGWRVDWDAAGNVGLDVFTVQNTRETTVSSGAVEFGANPRQVPLDLNGLGTIFPVSYRVVRKAAVKHDRIVVEGEPINVCATFDLPTGSLEHAWTPSEVTAYGAVDRSDAAKTDQARGQDQYKHIMQKFRIPEDWDGTLYNVSDVAFVGTYPVETVSVGTSQPFVGLPTFAEDGSIDATVVNPVLLNADKCRCLRNLPFQAEGGTTDTGDEFQKPMVFVRERTLQDGNMKFNGYFHALHVPYAGYGTENTGPRVAARITMLDQELGFQVDYPVPHVLGMSYGEQGTNVLGGDTNYDPLFDAFDVFATLNVQTDRRLRVVKYRNGFDATTAQTTKVIPVDGAALWLVAPYTVYGFEGDGNILNKQTGATWQRLRDDRDKLHAVAATAAAWYSQDRNAIALTIRGGLLQIVNTGTMLINVNANQRSEQVGTIVTSIQHIYGQGDEGREPEKTVIRTGYWEFDPGAMLNYSKLGNFQAVAREIDAVKGEVRTLKEHVSDLPVRQAAGGGSAATNGLGATSNVLIGGWCVAE